MRRSSWRRVFAGDFPAVFFAGVDFFATDFLAGVFFAAVFFAGADFLAGVFLADVFFAGADFFAAVFFAGAFFAAVFFGGVFLAPGFLAGAFLAAVFFAGALFAALFVGDFLGTDAFFEPALALVVVRVARRAAETARPARLRAVVRAMNARPPPKPDNTHERVAGRFGRHTRPERICRAHYPRQPTAPTIR